MTEPLGTVFSIQLLRAAETSVAPVASMDDGTL